MAIRHEGPPQTGSTPAETRRRPPRDKWTSARRAVVTDSLTSRRDIMRTLGYVAVIAMAAAGAALGLLAVKSAPDLRRYVAIRNM